ncbi:Protein FIZZY-RELATED 2 [Platanthera guangdongensis]|uniref:Protein FIZZY-RELATED 2 n=1 Tax=Platanthera guangdongensis TaxID=2320717 RepID=A0ABR2M1A3_9ASPA
MSVKTPKIARSPSHEGARPLAKAWSPIVLKALGGGRISTVAHSLNLAFHIALNDRFIPSRIGSNFALFDIASPPGGDGGKDHSSSPYATILRTVIFGSDHSVVPPVTPDRCSSSPSSASSTSLSSPRRNIFRFKAEVPRYSISSVVFDDALPAIVPSQPKETRKVPKSPYKVTKLCDLGVDDTVCSVGWAQRGTHLAVGTSLGPICEGNLSQFDR